MEYSRNGEKYTRFIDDFFGIDSNTQQPRFELVPEKGTIDKNIKKFEEGTLTVGELFDEIVAEIPKLASKLTGNSEYIYSGGK